MTRGEKKEGGTRLGDLGGFGDFFRKDEPGGRGFYRERRKSGR